MIKIDIKKWLMRYSEPRDLPKKENLNNYYYNDNFNPFISNNFPYKPMLDRKQVEEFLLGYSIDDTITPDFWFKRSSTHDGTYLFTVQLVMRTINSIFDEIQLYANHKWAGQKEITIDKVIITNIDYDTEYLSKVSDTQPWAGQKDSMKIGVKLILKTDE